MKLVNETAPSYRREVIRFHDSLVLAFRLIIKLQIPRVHFHPNIDDSLAEIIC
jgi:hypothetical protein